MIETCFKNCHDETNVSYVAPHSILYSFLEGIYYNEYGKYSITSADSNLSSRGCLLG